MKKEQNYSVLSAITGSFLEAILAGINPPIKVKVILIIISIIACIGFRLATPSSLDKLYIILLIGTIKILAITIPKIPLNKPIINVSALNTRVISFLRAPIAHKIPISLVRSSTDV